MAKAPGETTSSSSGSGARSNTKRVYLKAYDSVAQARAALGRYLAFYNSKRPHSSLGARTPDQAYFDHPPLARAA
jgi:putative transposase